MGERRTLGVMFLQSQAFFGADTAIHAQLMRHLDRRELRVHCACTAAEAHDPRMTAIHRIQEIPDVRVRVTDFGPSLFGRPPLAKVLATGGALRAGVRGVGLLRYLRRERIDVVHGTEKPRDAFVAIILSRLGGVKSVVHMHVGYDDWISSGARWALGQADAIVGVSRFVSQSLRQAGYASERVFTVHNSLDLADPAFAPQTDTNGVRRELGIAPEAPVICIASRLFRWKGHHDLVAAVARLCVELPEVRLLIVGEDDPRANPGGGSYREELVRNIRELGIERNVIFTGFRTDVPRLMASSDVFCQPSAEEPFGMVYLEAMAMGRPVVAYASGGASEVVMDGETGFVVERGDIAALSSALLRLLRNPRLRRQFGDAGRRRVETAFRPEQSAATMLEVYRALSGPGLPPRIHTTSR
jgi:glycosyltransferase involved in cell wall biosynthesis